MSTQTTPDAKIPSGPIADKWEKHKRDSALINPANKRKFTTIFTDTADPQIRNNIWEAKQQWWPQGWLEGLFPKSRTLFKQTRKVAFFVDFTMCPWRYH